MKYEDLKLIFFNSAHYATFANSIEQCAVYKAHFFLTIHFP